MYRLTTLFVIVFITSCQFNSKTDLIDKKNFDTKKIDETIETIKFDLQRNCKSIGEAAECYYDLYSIKDTLIIDSIRLITFHIYDNQPPGYFWIYDSTQLIFQNVKNGYTYDSIKIFDLNRWDIIKSVKGKFPSSSKNSDYFDDNDNKLLFQQVDRSKQHLDYLILDLNSDSIINLFGFYFECWDMDYPIVKMDEELNSVSVKFTFGCGDYIRIDTLLKY